MTITAPIEATVTLDPNGRGPLPELPASLGAPVVRWGFDDGKIETNILLTIDGEEEVVSFWTTDQDGTNNTAEDAFGTEGPTPWEDLDPEDLEAAVKWGNAVHARICEGAQAVTEAAAAVDSDAYNAVIAYATETPAPDDERTPKEMALYRAENALAVVETTGSDQEDLKLLMVDLLHHANENGLDLHQALKEASVIFQLEARDTFFSCGGF
jgi:hypothetical protein